MSVNYKMFRLDKIDGMSGNALVLDSFKSVILQEWSRSVTLCTTDSSTTFKLQVRLPTENVPHIDKTSANVILNTQIL